MTQLSGNKTWTEENAIDWKQDSADFQDKTDLFNSNCIIFRTRLLYKCYGDATVPVS